MDQEKFDQLILQLKKKHKKLRPYFNSSGTDCYRIHSMGVENAAVSLDIYGDALHISISESESAEKDIFTEEEIRKIGGALYIKPENIFQKTREKLKEHRQYSTKGEEKEFRTVTENGLKFLVNLHDYIDTGLFLDHRKTRQMIREDCTGKRVLNLFAYTGSFSVYAASGGAEAITTVDMSSNYLSWAEKNFRENDFLPGMFEFACSDVTPFLDKAGKEGRKWDIIILDPPTFSNSRKMEGVWDIQKDYEKILDLCSAVTAKGGVILFSTNYKRFLLNKRDLSGKFRIEDMTALTTDEDFLGKPLHRCWTLFPRKKGEKKPAAPSSKFSRRSSASGSPRRSSSKTERKVR